MHRMYLKCLFFLMWSFENKDSLLLNKYLPLDAGDVISELSKFCFCIWKSVDIHCHLMPAFACSVFSSSDATLKKVPYLVDSQAINSTRLTAHTVLGFYFQYAQRVTANCKVSTLAWCTHRCLSGESSRCHVSSLGVKGNIMQHG